MSGEDPLTAFLARKRTGLEVEEHPLTTGCGVLDGGLGGGLPGHGLTELVGASGTGKSQLALQLALTAQLPPDHGGRGKGVVFISTESMFPSNRLAQLAQHFRTRFPDQLPPDPMANIFLQHVPDADGLMDCLTHKLPAIVKTHPVGLLVIDSIAALYRSEDSLHRANHLRKTATTLHSLTAKNNITLIVINQVTASVAKGGDVPALGLNWRNFVTTRIVLCRNGDKRALYVPFSPSIKQQFIPFTLGPQGIQAPNNNP